MTGPYRLSFTTGGLFLNESVALAASYIAVSDWKRVVSEAPTTVSFSSEKSKSVRRVAREIVNRLSTLKDAELEYLVNRADRNEQAALMWLAVCRAYSLIREFAIEVVAEMYASYRRELTPDQYTTFVHDKAEWDEELAGRSKATIERSRQVLFKIMREVGFLNDVGQLSRLHISPSLRKLLRDTNADLRVFPGGAEYGGRGE